MSGHTPGPWVQKPSAVSDNICIYAGGKREGYGIGEAWNINDNAENFANARLIAAAPDLLAALESIARIDISEVGAWEKVAGRMQATALEAIEKATGGQS